MYHTEGALYLDFHCLSLKKGDVRIGLHGIYVGCYWSVIYDGCSDTRLPNIYRLEVIPAQSAYPYRLIGSLSLPIRLCVRLPPSSPLPLTLPPQASGLRRGLRISISPMLSIFASVSVSIPPLPLTLPPLLFPPSLPPFLPPFLPP